MNSSFKALAIGIIGAVILVYLLMVMNFQSWLDPLIILMALPGAIAGILWMLFATPHDDQRAEPDGLDHVHRRGDGEQHSDDHVRQRSPKRTRCQRPRRGLCRRHDAPAAGHHDGPGDDHRHVADVAWDWAKAASRTPRWAGR